MSMYFFYQEKGGEDTWVMALSDKRAEVVSRLKPRFTTVLDLTAVPADNDFSKVKYRGPLYFDFDAGGDIDRVIDAVRGFLGELVTKYNFDAEQAYYYCSGSKGFHIEIPMECFIPKPTKDGYASLPYIYKEMAQAVVVDTMDMVVYTGKRGRQWRTPNVERENGKYKVPVTLHELMEMTSETYHDLIKAPRHVAPPMPPSCHAMMAAAFDLAKDKVHTWLKGKPKRTAKANKLLDPYRKAKRHPKTIQGLMSGEIVKDGLGFQRIAMQLAIYGTSMDMGIDKFVDACEGLVEKHESDSYRYNTKAKRQEELRRMYRYMEDNVAYDFDAGPIVACVKPGVEVADMGMEFEEEIGKKGKAPSNDSDDDSDSEVVIDSGDSLRKGFRMSRSGMARQGQNGPEMLCRAYLDDIEAFYTLEDKEFCGYEVTLKELDTVIKRTFVVPDTFSSSASFRKFMMGHQLAYGGTDYDTTALFDQVSRNVGDNQVYTYPREGLFVISHPNPKITKPVIAYLTQNAFMTNVDGTPDAFKLRYKPSLAWGAYQIDLDLAPALDVTMADTVQHLFGFSRPDTVGWLLGWFMAAHYRSFFLRLFGSFPLLQIHGQAGSGKTHVVKMLGALHWYRTQVQISSASSFTPFALDNAISTSTSAPCIIDEYKPRELKKMRFGGVEKLKDIMKASYTGDHIGNRGTINRVPASTGLDVIKSTATAPLVFMTEAMENETAILERSVTVTLAQSYFNADRTIAYEALCAHTEVLSAIGRRTLEMAFELDLEEMRSEVQAIRRRVDSEMAMRFDFVPPRLRHNKTVVIYGLTMLKRVLATCFGNYYDDAVDELINQKYSQIESEETLFYKLGSISEIAKVLSQIAQNSFNQEDVLLEFKRNIDYLVSGDYLEIRVDRAYDNYRKYCARINDTPLFDNSTAFRVALMSFSAVKDKLCTDSLLRKADGELVVRLDLEELQKAGVQSFNY